MRRFAGVTATILVAVLLAGCQPVVPPTTPPPSPTSSPTSPTAVPTPTYRCTPEAGGEEAPCSQVDYEEMKAKDALYAEAEAVYQKMFAENIRISRAGGVDQPTQIILETTDGQARSSLMEIFRDLDESHVSARGEDPTIYVERAPGLSREGSIVTLLVCVDASQWAFYRGEELITEGRPAQDRIYFSRLGEDLKMTYVEGRWVDACK